MYCENVTESGVTSKITAKVIAPANSVNEAAAGTYSQPGRTD